MEAVTPLALAFGLDPNMGAASLAGAVLTKWVIYPLVQMRRRRAGEEDAEEGTGRPVVPARLQGGLALVLVSIVVAGGAAALGEPILPSVAAAATGYALARITHEAKAKPPAP